MTEPSDVAMRLALSLQRRGLISRVFVAAGDALALEPDAIAIATACTLDDAGVREAVEALGQYAMGRSCPYCERALAKLRGGAT